MPTVETKIHLPPGTVTLDAQRKLIDLFFGAAPIFAPVKYGRVDGDTALDATNPQKILADFWSKWGILTVTGKPASHFVTIFPNKQGESAWTGSISWCAQQKIVNNRWRVQHIDKVAQAMKILGSPLAYAGLETDLESKCWQLIDEPLGGQRLIPILSVPREGIPGMFWRLFIGAPFTAHMPALENIDPPQARDLGGGLWMMSPYADPNDADTEFGKLAETELIGRVGSDFFYDHKTHTLPKRLPILGD